MAGYSGTPLAKKLGIKEEMEAYVENSPIAYEFKNNKSENQDFGLVSNR